MNRALSACVVASWLAAGSAHADVPQVLASIAPIHSLTAAVMEGIGAPELLVSPTVSEHDYALKPSDVRKISGADLVVWIGAPLETYLVKALETESVQQLELIDAAGVDPHPFQQERRAHEEEDIGAHDAEEKAQTDEAGHEHSGLDPHVWLDPVRAVKIVEAIAGALAAVDPENAGRYRENATRMIGELDALDQDIRARLAPVAARPFITFHDGYSYFVERYGLNQVGQFTVDPDRRPGAATVRALRETIAAERVGCAFSEPQFDPDVVEGVAGEARMRVGVLDAIGAGLELGPTLYASLLRRNTEAVENCLLPNS